MTNVPEAPLVRLTLQEPGGTPYDMRGSFGLLLVQQADGSFTLVAGSAPKLSDEDFGTALSQALLVFIKATAAHPGVADPVRQVAKLISADMEVKGGAPTAEAAEPAESTHSSVSCQVRGEGFLSTPPALEGDYVVACARQGLRFSVVKAPAPNLDDAECGRALAGSWITLTRAVADDPTVTPSVRQWARSIVEEFAIANQRAARDKVGPN